MPKHPPAPPSRGRRPRHHRRGARGRPPVRPQGQRLPRAVGPERRGVPRRRRGDRPRDPAPPRGDRDRRRRGPGPVRGPGDPCRDPRRAPGPAVAHGPPRAASPRPPTPGRDHGRRAGQRSLHRHGGGAPGSTSSTGGCPLNGADLEALAREHGTPLFVYDLARPAENVRELQDALRRAGVPHRVRFALKASPDPAILRVLRGLGAPGSDASVGIDACSPGEVTHALAHGWLPDEISHTGTNVSERDLDVLLAHPIRLNLDAVSQLERVGRRAPGRTVGIRINPGAGAGYTEHLAYAGERPTKFGDHRRPARRRDRGGPAARARRRHAALPRRLRLAGRPARRASRSRSSRRPGSSTACSTPAARSAR